MDIPKRISEIEIELFERDLKIGPVLFAAGVDRSSWTRWKQGGVSPTVAKWNAVEQAVQRALRLAAA